MALINCPECGKEISDTSDVCIHCGYKLKSKTQGNVQRRRKPWLIPVIIGGIIATFLVIGIPLIYLIYYVVTQL